MFGVCTRLPNFTYYPRRNSLPYEGFVAMGEDTVECVACHPCLCLHQRPSCCVGLTHWRAVLSFFPVWCRARYPPGVFRKKNVMTLIALNKDASACGLCPAGKTCPGCHKEVVSAGAVQTAKIYASGRYDVIAKVPKAAGLIWAVWYVHTCWVLCHRRVLPCPSSSYASGIDFVCAVTPQDVPFGRSHRLALVLGLFVLQGWVPRPQPRSPTQQEGSMEGLLRQCSGLLPKGTIPQPFVPPNVGVQVL